MFNSNASSADAGGADYIEDVFSTWLYTGNGSTQTINNGIDLSGKGGLVWTKARVTAFDHYLFDTARGAAKALRSNTTGAEDSGYPTSLTAFNANGFSVGNSAVTNFNAEPFASWTFREQPKFFDVVTYTGDGVAGRTVTHNLGSVPGCIIVKPTSTSGEWRVWHRALAAPATSFLFLNRTDAEVTGSTIWNSTNPTSTNFTVSGSASNNGAGVEYVAYLFAHNAGGFGLSGTDNVISCGSFTTDGSGNASVTLGYEPQWVLYKRSSGLGDWLLLDSMRDMSYTTSAILYPNLSDAESSGVSPSWINATATGFGAVNGRLASGQTYIYIAIRRGPMKVPTDGTKVFSPNSVNGSTGQVVTTNFAVDSQIWNYTNGTSLNSHVYDRLRGISSTTTESGQGLVTSSTAAEVTDSYVRGWNNTGFQVPSGINGAPVVYYNFVRAPGFFDEVCYTGNGGAQTIKHNLNVVPELIIGRNRTGSNWSVNFNFATTTQSYAFLNLTDSGGNLSYAGAGVFSGAPTSTEMYLVNSGSMNGSGQGIVAYLFASCPGVSKIGVYTGTATTLQINCGFTAGARFVLIKRTDAAGDWYVWDSARGIVAGNDPYLLLNTNAAEVTSTDYVDTYSAGFELTSTAPAALNASGGTYIFLAIA
jgi:hypothetical protein